MDKWVAAVESKLFNMQAQIANVVRLQRYLVEGHLKLHEDRVVICREHLALFQCLTSEGVVSRNVLTAYMQAQKLSDQFHGCLHDSHVARLIVQSLGVVGAARLSSTSPTCHQHVLECVPADPLTAEEVDMPWTMAMLLRCFPVRKLTIEAPLSEPSIIRAVVKIAGRGAPSALAAASRCCRSSLRVGTPKEDLRAAEPGRRPPLTRHVYTVLSQRSVASKLAAAIGISARELAAASWACKEAVRTKLPEGPCSKLKVPAPKRRRPAQPLGRRLHSVLSEPRLALGVARGLGHALPAAASQWCFACLQSIPGIRRSASSREPRRAKPPDPVYCSNGGTSGPSFALAVNFDGAALPKPPLTLAARVRTSLKTCQVIVGWATADGCASAEFRLRSGSLEYMERLGMWWGWKSVASCDEIDLVDGAWHGVAVVRLESGDVSLYADGKLIGKGAIEDAIPTGLEPIAKSAHLHRSWNGYAFDGEIGPLLIYDRALSLEQLCLVGIFPTQCDRKADSKEPAEIWSSFRAIEADLEHSAINRPRHASRNSSAMPASSSQHLSSMPPFLETDRFSGFEVDHPDSWSMAAQALSLIDLLHSSDNYAEAERQHSEVKAGRARGCL